MGLLWGRVHDRLDDHIIWVWSLLRSLLIHRRGFSALRGRAGLLWSRIRGLQIARDLQRLLGNRNWLSLCLGWRYRARELRHCLT